MAKLGWLKLIEPLKLTWVVPPTGKLYVFTSNQIVCNNKDCVQSLRKIVT